MCLFLYLLHSEDPNTQLNSKVGTLCEVRTFWLISGSGLGLYLGWVGPEGGAGKYNMSIRVLTKIEGLMSVWPTDTRLEVTGRKSEAAG